MILIAVAAGFLACALSTSGAQQTAAEATTPILPVETPASTAPADATPVPTGATAPVAPTDAVQPIDFQREVQPIFALHCVKCHGVEKHSGGLRLDERLEAGLGGDSGKPILGGNLETNEVYQRVSSTERTYRMPKNAPALNLQEIDAIKRWVQQGAKWSIPAAPHAGPDWFFDRWVLRLSEFSHSYKAELEYIRPFGAVFLLVQIALLLANRAKTAYNNNRPWAVGRIRPICAFCSRLSTREWMFVWLLTVGAMAMVTMRGHQLGVEAELAKWKAMGARYASSWTRTIYGYPPKPLRPGHDKQIAGTYYRGNCERNPELFNNGNYLTATFRVSLCDAAHGPIQLGDALPPQGLLLRMELERAPGTADALYSKEMIASVFLSETFLDASVHDVDLEVTRLEILEDGQRWVAYVPLKRPDAAGRCDGLIYVYTGHIEPGKTRGEPHYAIQYSLIFKDGRLDAESDVWMNSFGNPVFAQPEPAEKLPYREWFDYRPIPPITGKNSTNPKLLGVDEYVKKGLIKPDANPTQAPPATSTPPPEPAPAGQSPQPSPAARPETQEQE